MNHSSNPIIIVSGLPRSGTSLMMQMLSLGGLEALTDELRTADTDNPKGYLEFERVKKIKQDKAWLPDARGKVVKMISQLLYDLPDTESYRIIFMRRELDEIIASQEKMLERRGAAIPNRDSIKAAFTAHLDKLFVWLSTRCWFELIEVSYNELVLNPAAIVSRLQEFIPQPLDAVQMLAAVDPSLYRNQKT